MKLLLIHSLRGAHLRGALLLHGALLHGHLLHGVSLHGALLHLCRAHEGHPNHAIVRHRHRSLRVRHITGRLEVHDSVDAWRIEPEDVNWGFPSATCVQNGDHAMNQTTLAAVLTYAAETLETEPPRACGPADYHEDEPEEVGQNPRDDNAGDQVIRVNDGYVEPGRSV